jgi:predicted DNA-binding transcriptional regulator AlpA
LADKFVFGQQSPHRAIKCQFRAALPSRNHFLPFFTLYAHALAGMETVLHRQSQKPMIGPCGASDCQRIGTHAMYNAELIIRVKAVLANTGLSRATIYRNITDGTSPSQITINVNCSDRVGYRETGADQ